MPFLEDVYKTNPLKGEYFLPFVVDELLQEKKAEVTVLPVSYTHLDVYKRQVCMSFM